MNVKSLVGIKNIIRDNASRSLP